MVPPGAAVFAPWVTCVEATAAEDGAGEEGTAGEEEAAEPCAKTGAVYNDKTTTRLQTKPMRFIELSAAIRTAKPSLFFRVLSRGPSTMPPRLYAGAFIPGPRNFAATDSFFGWSHC